ncbi:hypothetical protein F4805DRAFT_460526 [Annulohypoxylon moriforme]|nr:hypothetical protein F4805DRAFT_460526 [Annulohypoxylon moriforme]
MAASILEITKAAFCPTSSRRTSWAFLTRTAHVIDACLGKCNTNLSLLQCNVRRWDLERPRLRIINVLGLVVLVHGHCGVRGLVSWLGDKHNHSHAKWPCLRALGERKPPAKGILKHCWWHFADFCFHDLSTITFQDWAHQRDLTLKLTLQAAFQVRARLISKALYKSNNKIQEVGLRREGEPGFVVLGFAALVDYVGYLQELCHIKPDLHVWGGLEPAGGPSGLPRRPPHHSCCCPEQPEIEESIMVELQYKKAPERTFRISTSSSQWGTPTAATTNYVAIHPG